MVVRVAQIGLKPLQCLHLLIQHIVHRPRYLKSSIATSTAYWSQATVDKPAGGEVMHDSLAKPDNLNAKDPMTKALNPEPKSLGYSKPEIRNPKLRTTVSSPNTLSPKSKSLS